MQLTQQKSRLGSSHCDDLLARPSSLAKRRRWRRYRNYLRTKNLSECFMDCFAARSAKTIKSSNRYNITRSYYYEQVPTRLAHRHLQNPACTRCQGALGVPDCVRRWQSCLTRAIPTGQDAPRAPCLTPLASIATLSRVIVGHPTASGPFSFWG